MAIASRGRMELPMNRNRETSPERTKIWAEPKAKQERKVPVIYYLCRNGQLEHPHFMEVALSSCDGLYLRDVINRFNIVRGKGMASMYSWSSKRSYKNRFVWHDLSDNDFIYPVQGHEYVLKGSELPQASPDKISSMSVSSQDLQEGSAGRSQEVSSSSNQKALVLPKSGTTDLIDDSTFPVNRNPYGKNPSWKSLDVTEYKVYKTESTAETAGKAADASTQTDDKRRRRRETSRGISTEDERYERNPSTVLSREEISPPPSSSPSPDADGKAQKETLESLIKADGHIINNSGILEEPDVDVRVVNNARTKASTVLMQLISCGSMSVNDHSLSLMSHYRHRVPGGPNQVSKSSVVDRELEYCLADNPRFAGIQLEDKEYFSGSLIETKRNNGVAEFPSLKRSSSCNADRNSQSDLLEKEIDGVRAKCIPRKMKSSAKKESSGISRRIHGSKPITAEHVKPSTV